MRAEDITPYRDTRGKTEQVREMFDNIAPAYDRLNRAMSFGLDRSWRRKAVRLIAALRPATVYDIASGTGDFAIALARAIPRARVVGLDLAPEMAEIGRRKIERAGLSGRADIAVGDCLASPLPEGAADAVTVAFGVRNFADLPAGYRAMRAMLRPGGMLCVLELSTPASSLVRPFYKLYTGCVIPLMGRIVSHDTRAYSYLPESIAAVPQRRDMLRIMEEAGYVNTSYKSLTMGVCTLYIGYNPA